jgi:hypothetical protein
MASRDLPATVGVSVTVPGDEDCPQPLLADGGVDPDDAAEDVVVAAVAAVVEDALLPEPPHAAIATGMAIRQAAHHGRLRLDSVWPASVEDLILPAPCSCKRLQ